MRPSLCGRALATSAGIAIGRIQRLVRGRQPIPEFRLPGAHIASEIERLEAALAGVLAEIDQEREQLRRLRHHDPLLILDTHRMLASDPELIDRARELIRREAINAEWAIRRRSDAIEAVFDAVDDPYLRARKMDVEQVADRLLRRLQGSSVSIPKVEEGELPLILVGDDFSPTDTVSLWRNGVTAFVAEQGGINSHSIIIARSIGLPALMGASGIMEHARDGDTLIVDGERGIWILNPSSEERQEYTRFSQAIRAVHDDLLLFAGLPSQSADGHRLQIMANIEFTDELELAMQLGVDGIGLFRTEFLFLNAESLPDEEAQQAIYTQVVQRMGGRPVVFRLLDLGGEKMARFDLPGGGSQHLAENPAMGLRGVRLLLHWPALLEAQLSAILRAGDAGPMQIMVPMVAHLEEMVQVREIARHIALRLGKPVPRIGAMIETPAAVLIADELATVSDFFSVGTNDLTQYTLAVDRSNEEVGSLYRPNHPAIWRQLAMTVEAAKRGGIPVSLCGEMAADDRCTEALLRLGFDALSMSLNRVLPIRRQLSLLNFHGEAATLPPI